MRLPRVLRHHRHQAGHSALPSADRCEVLSFTVNAGDAFVMRRVLVAGKGLDIIRCSPIKQQGELRVRVEAVISGDSVEDVMRNVLQVVTSAQFDQPDRVNR